jgi:hypothetical protein
MEGLRREDVADCGWLVGGYLLGDRWRCDGVGALNSAELKRYGSRATAGGRWKGFRQEVAPTASGIPSTGIRSPRSAESSGCHGGPWVFRQQSRSIALAACACCSSCSMPTGSVRCGCACAGSGGAAPSDGHHYIGARPHVSRRGSVVRRTSEEHVKEGARGEPPVRGEYRRPDLRRLVREQMGSQALAARQRVAAEKPPARAGKRRPAVLAREDAVAGGKDDEEKALLGRFGWRGGEPQRQCSGRWPRAAQRQSEGRGVGRRGAATVGVVGARDACLGTQARRSALPTVTSPGPSPLPSAVVVERDWPLPTGEVPTSRPASQNAACGTA